MNASKFIVLSFLHRRHRLTISLLCVWTFVATWLFAWLASQTELREGFAKLMKVLPAKILEKISAEAQLLIEPTGAIALALTHPLILFPPLIIAMLLPLRHLASDQERGVLDMMLSRPLARHHWILALLLVQVSALLSIGVSISLSIIFASKYFSGLASINTALLLSLVFTQQLWAFAVGGFTAAVAAYSGRFRVAVSFAIAFVILNMLFEVLCRTIPSWSSIIVFSLWHWAEPRALFQHPGTIPIAMIILGTAGSIFWLYAIGKFSKRDLSTR